MHAAYSNPKSPGLQHLSEHCHHDYLWQIKEAHDQGIEAQAQPHDQGIEAQAQPRHQNILHGEDLQSGLELHCDG